MVTAFNTARDQIITWKTYQRYPFIEVNQFGEIRMKDRCVSGKNGRKRLYKGYVLKQYLSNNGYMQVQFKVNGKTIHLYVHRIVAESFIPNPLGFPEVNHIDCNRINNAVSNLEWCTRSYNRQYREKYGEAWGRPIFAVNLETYEVLQFKSQKEAELKLGIDKSAIGKVIRGQLKTAGNFWFTEDKKEITKEKILEIKANMRFPGGVIAINLDTFKVLYFKSQHEAGRQLSINPRRISDVLKGRLKTSHKFCFYCAGRNAAEKTRAKFGNELANKVEELIDNNYN